MYSLCLSHSRTHTHLKSLLTTCFTFIFIELINDCPSLVENLCHSNFLYLSFFSLSLRNCHLDFHSLSIMHHQMSLVIFIVSSSSSNQRRNHYFVNYEPPWRWLRLNGNFYSQIPCHQSTHLDNDIKGSISLMISKDR